MFERKCGIAQPFCLWQKPWGKIGGSYLNPLNDETFLSFQYCVMMASLSEGCDGTF